MVNLKEFVFDCCDFLGIAVTKLGQKEIFELVFPNSNVNEFVQPTIRISFKKSDDPKVTYLTKESFLVKKLAELVDKNNPGVAVGNRSFLLESQVTNFKRKLTTDCSAKCFDIKTQTEDWLSIWFKVSLPGYFTEQRMSCLEYKFADGTIRAVPSDGLELLEETYEGALEGIQPEAIDRAVTELEKYVQKHAVNIFSEKLNALEKEMQKEINRIDDYYKKLQYEASQSITKARSAAEELGLLNQERNNLIEQLKKKYAIDFSDIKIEPAAIMLIRNHIENGKVVLYNKFGRYGLTVRSDNPLEIKCKETGNTDGPLTVTSDNELILANRTYKCQECNRLRQLSHAAQCSVCKQNFCKECTQKSQISSRVVCTHHSQLCSMCKNTCASDEIIGKCTSCGKTLCNNCLKITCTICGSKVCSNCLTYSVVSNSPLCSEHSITCQSCHGSCKEDELYRCTN